MYNNRNVRRPLSVFLMVLLIFSGGIIFPTDRNIANAEPVATDNSAESAAAQDPAGEKALSTEQQDTDAKDTEAVQGENETSETAQDKEESSETAQDETGDDEAVTEAEDGETSEEGAPAEEVQAPKKANAGPRKVAASGTVIDNDTTYWGHWSNWNVTDDVTITGNGVLRMQGTDPKITGSTITTDSSKAFAIIVYHDNKDMRYSLINETIKASKPNGMLVVWNNARALFQDSTIDGNNLDFGGKSILQTSNYQSRIGFLGNSTIQNVKNAVIANGEPGGGARTACDVYVEKDSTLTIKDSTVEFGGTNPNGKLNIYQNGKLVVEGSTVTSDDMRIQGSGVEITLDDSELNTKSATVNIDHNATLTMKNNSKVTGKVVVKFGSTLVLDGPNDTSNVVLENGALLELKNGAKFEIGEGKTLKPAKVSVTSGNCELSGKGTLDMNGGVVDIVNGANLNSENLTITNATINDDDFTLTDGTLNNTTINVSAGDTTTLTNCTVTNCRFNVAAGGTLIVNGGVMDAYNFDINGTASFDGTEFKNGQYHFDVNNGAELTLTNVNVHDNTRSTNGGLVSANKGSTVTIDGGKFENNSVSARGGVLYASEAALITVKGKPEFKNNTADQGGGVIYLDQSKASIGEASFIENGCKWATDSNGDPTWTGSKITSHGGAIYVNNSEITLEKTTFNKNEAAAQCH